MHKILLLLEGTIFKCISTTTQYVHAYKNTISHYVKVSDPGKYYSMKCMSFKVFEYLNMKCSISGHFKEESTAIFRLCSMNCLT